MEGQLVKYHCDTLFYCSFVLYMVKTQQTYLTAVNIRDVQQAADSRGLSGTILPDKAHDTAPRYIKADIVQHKAVIALGHAFYFNCIFICVHIILLHLQDRAARAARRC